MLMCLPPSVCSMDIKVINMRAQLLLRRPVWSFVFVLFVSAGCTSSPDPASFKSESVLTSDLLVLYMLDVDEETGLGDLDFGLLKLGTDTAPGLLTSGLESSVSLSGGDQVVVYSDRSIEPIATWDADNPIGLLTDIEFPATLNIQVQRALPRVSALDTFITVQGSIDTIFPNEGETYDLDEPLEFSWSWNNNLGFPTDSLKLSGAEVTLDCANGRVTTNVSLDDEFSPITKQLPPDVRSSMVTPCKAVIALQINDLRNDNNDVFLATSNTDPLLKTHLQNISIKSRITNVTFR